MPRKQISGYSGSDVDVAYWIEQIRWGLVWRKEKAYEARWDTWNKYYKGEWLPNILPHNLFFRMVRSIVPKIYFRNPSVSVMSTRPGVENYILAEIMQGVDNQLIRQMGIKQEMKRMVQSSWLYGTGVGKIGFGAKYASMPSPDGDSKPPIVSGNRELLEYDFGILPNMPWFRHTNTRNFLVPYGCIRYEDARWTCFIINRPVEDVIRDPRFKTPDDLSGTDYLDAGGLGVNKQERFKNVNETIDLYEIRDRKTNKVFVICGSHDKALRYEDDVFGSLGIDPGYILQFNDVDDAFWAVPDSQILEPLQRETNEIHTYAMYHRRLSILKIAYDAGMVDNDELVKILNGDILAGIKVNGNPRDAINIFQAGSVPLDLFQMANMLDGMTRDVMGMSRNQAGEFKEGSRSPTATEVQEVSEASNIRTDERRDMTADVLTKMVTDVNPILFRNWTQETITQVLGPGGVPIWVQFTPEMLKRGQYRYKVDPDSSIPDTKDLRQAKALKLYEVFKENPLIDPIKLTQYLLREMNGVDFNEMLRGLPAGAGMSPQAPMSVGQLGQFMQQAQQQGLPGNVTALPQRGAAPGGK